MSDKKFPDGIIAKRADAAPDFVICNLSFKTDEFIKYLQDNANNGWVNLDVKRSKGGKIYCDKNDYKPKQTTDTEDDTMPF